MSKMHQRAGSDLFKLFECGIYILLDFLSQ